MSKEILSILSDSMKEMKLNYEFMEWTSSPAYPYFTGEYQEVEPINEDGFQESMFILNGFSRGSWLEMENAKQKIKSYFNKVSGKLVIAKSGFTAAVFYAHSLVIPTDDAELKKIQINLTVKEWSV